GLGLIVAVVAALAVVLRRRRARQRALDLSQEMRVSRRIDEFVKHPEEPARRQMNPTSEWRNDRGPRPTPLGSIRDSGVLSDPAPLEPAVVPTLISVPSLESSSPEEAMLAGDALGRRHAAIWMMADSGLSAEAIATATGQPIGEIQLIL